MKQGRENSRVATHFAVQSTATQNSAKGLTLPTFIGDSGSGTSAFCFYCLSPQGQLSEKGIIGFSFPLNSLYTKNLRRFGFYYNKEAEPLQALLLRFYEKKPPFYQRKHRIFFRQNFIAKIIYCLHNLFIPDREISPLPQQHRLHRSYGQ